ncbi:unnamed protein product [Amoebophrya sp. A120]|nr:unnamed protein product [Amoebophrya sp. A120]|eukprot:GSA120T00016561001.1
MFFPTTYAQFQPQPRVSRSASAQPRTQFFQSVVDTSQQHLQQQQHATAAQHHRRGAASPPTFALVPPTLNGSMSSSSGGNQSLTYNQHQNHSHSHSSTRAENFLPVGHQPRQVTSGNKQMSNGVKGSASGGNGPPAAQHGKPLATGTKKTSSSSTFFSPPGGVMVGKQNVHKADEINCRSGAGGKTGAAVNTSEAAAFAGGVGNKPRPRPEQVARGPPPPAGGTSEDRTAGSQARSLILNQFAPSPRVGGPFAPLDHSGASASAVHQLGGAGPSAQQPPQRQQSARVLQAPNMVLTMPHLNAVSRSISVGPRLQMHGTNNYPATSPRPQPLLNVVCRPQEQIAEQDPVVSRINRPPSCSNAASSGVGSSTSREQQPRSAAAAASTCATKQMNMTGSSALLGQGGQRAFQIEPLSPVLFGRPMFGGAGGGHINANSNFEHTQNYPDEQEALPPDSARSSNITQPPPDALITPTAAQSASSSSTAFFNYGRGGSPPPMQIGWNSMTSSRAPGNASSRVGAQGSHHGPSSSHQPQTMNRAQRSASVVSLNSNSNNIVHAPKGICPPDIHAPRRIRTLKEQVTKDSKDVTQKRDLVDELTAIAEDKDLVREKLTKEVGQLFDETSYYKTELRGLRIDNQQLANEICQMENTMKEKDRINHSFCETLKKSAKSTVMSLELKQLERRVVELPPKIEQERAFYEKENETLLFKLSTAEADLQKGHDDREQGILDANLAWEEMKQKRSDAEAKKSLQVRSLEETRRKFQTEKEALNAIAKQKSSMYKCMMSSNKKVGDQDKKDGAVLQKIRQAEGKIKQAEVRLESAAKGADAREQDQKALLSRNVEAEKEKEQLEGDLKTLVKTLIDLERANTEKERQATASSPLFTTGYNLLTPEQQQPVANYLCPTPPTPLPKMSYLETQLSHLPFEKLVYHSGEDVLVDRELLCNAAVNNGGGGSSTDLVHPPGSTTKIKVYKPPVLSSSASTTAASSARVSASTIHVPPCCILDLMQMAHEEETKEAEQWRFLAQTSKQSFAPVLKLEDDGKEAVARKKARKRILSELSSLTGNVAVVPSPTEL